MLVIVLAAMAALVFLPVPAIKHQMPALASIAYLVFHPLCHQEASRSFHISGVQLAVCARCAGIYIGLLLGALFFLAVRRRVPKSVWVLFAAFVLDGLLNFLGLVSTPDWARFLLGLGFGFGSGWLLGFGVRDLEKMLSENRERKWRTGNIT